MLFIIFIEFKNKMRILMSEKQLVLVLQNYSTPVLKWLEKAI